MCGLLFMESIGLAGHTRLASGLIVPSNVAEVIFPKPVATTTIEPLTEGTVSIDYHRARFEAQKGLTDAASLQATETGNGINTAEEVTETATAQADNSAQLAEQCKRIGLAIAASIVDKQDKQFITQIAEALKGVEAKDSGVQIGSIEDVRKTIATIQDIYVTAQQSQLAPEVTQGAIKKQLESLQLNSEQKAAMQSYLAEVLKQEPAGQSNSDTVAWLKEKAVSKEGMLAAGTALYVLSNLLAHIPVIGQVLAAPIHAVQGLLGMAKELIPVLLVLDKKRNQESTVTPAPKPSSQARPTPATTAV